VYWTGLSHILYLSPSLLFCIELVNIFVPELLSPLFCTWASLSPILYWCGLSPFVPEPLSPILYWACLYFCTWASLSPILYWSNFSHILYRPGLSPILYLSFYFVLSLSIFWYCRVVGYGYATATLKNPSSSRCQAESLF
jgi:hypothetical protein